MPWQSLWCVPSCSLTFLESDPNSSSLLSTAILKWDNQPYTPHSLNPVCAQSTFSPCTCTNSSVVLYPNNTDVVSHPPPLNPLSNTSLFSLLATTYHSHPLTNLSIHYISHSIHSFRLFDLYQHYSPLT